VLDGIKVVLGAFFLFFLINSLNLTKLVPEFNSRGGILGTYGTFLYKPASAS
jgi:hypothetical protein